MPARFDNLSAAWKIKDRQRGRRGWKVVNRIVLELFTKGKCKAQHLVRLDRRNFMIKAFSL